MRVLHSKDDENACNCLEAYFSILLTFYIYFYVKESAITMKLSDFGL